MNNVTFSQRFTDRAQRKGSINYAAIQEAGRRANFFGDDEDNEVGRQKDLQKALVTQWGEKNDSDDSDSSDDCPEVALNKKKDKAAKKILRFWRKVKLRRLLARQRRQKKSASLIVFMSFVVANAALVIKAFWNVALVWQVCALFNLYMALLVWSATLPLRKPWHVRSCLGCVAYSIVVPAILDYGSLDVGVGWSLLLFFAGIYLYDRLLASMAKTLQYTYANDIRGLSSRLSGKIIAGLPIVGYFSLTFLSTLVEYQKKETNMCKYLPGAYFDESHTHTDSFVAGKWKNCTEGVHLTSHITDICTTVHEVMLSESVKDYLAVEAKITLSGMQMAETTGLFLTFQTLLRVCRLTINDILGARVSVWEFLLAWLTAVRLITAAVVSGMNFQDFASDGFFFALFSMWAATFVIIIIVARDAEIAVRMEKARNKEKAKHNETILQRRKLSRKQSVKVIMARPRRRTSVASNKSSAAAFARQERLSMDQVNSAKKAAKVIKRKASLLAKKRFEVPKNLEGQLHPALLNMVKEQEKQLELARATEDLNVKQPSSQQGPVGINRPEFRLADKIRPERRASTLGSITELAENAEEQEDTSSSSSLSSSSDIEDFDQSQNRNETPKTPSPYALKLPIEESTSVDINQ